MSDTAEQPEPPKPDTSTPQAVEEKSSEPQAAAAQTTAQPHPRRASRLWALTTMVAILAALGGFIAHRFFATAEHTADRVTETTQTIIDVLSKAFKTGTRVKTTVQSTVNELRSEAKLVVLQSEIDVEVRRSDETHLIYTDLSLGEKVVLLRVPGNRVQYCVSLESFGAENFFFDETKNELVVFVPAPQLDEAMVSVQSDPEKLSFQVEKGKWNPLTTSTKTMEKKARADLRAAVIEAGKAEAIRQQARAEADTLLHGLLSEVAASLRTDVTLRVEFIDNPKPADSDEDAGTAKDEDTPAESAEGE